MSGNISINQLKFETNDTISILSQGKISLKEVLKPTKLFWSSFPPFKSEINRLVDEWVMNYDANDAAVKRHWANKSSFDPLMNVS